MQTHHRSASSFRPSLPLVMLLLLFAALWLAGGASRADVAGQAVVRGVAWLSLIVAALFVRRPSLSDAGPVVVFLLLAALLVMMQLIPLPPGIWQALPGRERLADAARIAGEAQPWRPWSIVPSATWNALSSLVVPLAVLTLATSLRPHERGWLPSFVLGLVCASAVSGLLQLSGTEFTNPLINATPGQMSGSFANRNHFALFLAMGCLLAPVWAFLDGPRPHWRGPVAIGLTVLFVLAILVSGSRAGIVLGVFALIIGAALIRHELRRELRRAPRWALPALIAAIVATIAIFVLISIAADRAESISRAVASDSGEELRSRALPTVISMVQTYFPAGTGFGSFDPLFRIHEPFDLLTIAYFNHAHNDLLEIVLDGGLPALVLMLAALGWWGSASVSAWRRGPTTNMLARLGSALLLLVFVASTVDYPARTPMIMSVMILAAVWLCSRKTA